MFYTICAFCNVPVRRTTTETEVVSMCVTGRDTRETISRHGSTDENSKNGWLQRRERTLTQTSRAQSKATMNRFRSRRRREHEIADTLVRTKANVLLGIKKESSNFRTRNSNESKVNVSVRLAHFDHPPHTNVDSLCFCHTNRKHSL